VATENIYAASNLNIEDAGAEMLFSLQCSLYSSNGYVSNVALEFALLLLWEFTICIAPPSQSTHKSFFLLCVK